MRFICPIALLTLGLSCVQADVISYIRFEEGSGFGAFDETGLLNGDVLNFSTVAPGGGDTGHEGWSASVPSTTVPLTGEANTGSIRFAGGSEFIDLHNTSPLDLGTVFTIEMFIKPGEPEALPLFGFSPFSRLFFMLTGSGTNFTFRGQFQGLIDSNVSGSLVQANQWQHIALVMEPNDYAIYVEGQLQYAGPIPSGGEGPYIFAASGITGDRTIGDGFRGWIDEFRISDEALTPDQFLNAVPEPSTLALLLLALGTLAGVGRRSGGSS